MLTQDKGSGPLVHRPEVLGMPPSALMFTVQQPRGQTRGRGYSRTGCLTSSAPRFPHCLEEGNVWTPRTVGEKGAQ